MNLRMANETMIRKQIISRGVKNELVIKAMRKVLRHEFVSEEYSAFAYSDSALPYSEGQTISQPYIVASMAEIVMNGRVSKGKRILEIGTGSGYQTAVLAQLFEHVFTIDIIPSFLESAKARLDSLGYMNVSYAQKNGYDGWIEHFPYDGILTSCAASEVPETLLHQLADGGCLTMPVGKVEQDLDGYPYGKNTLPLQHMFTVTKNNFVTERKKLYPVMFLPMIAPFFG